MTGYTIRVGYLSGYSCDHSREEAWEIIKQEALSICDAPHVIWREAVRFGAPYGMGGEAIEDYAESFKRREDLTITFHEDGENAPRISMSASGGEPGRGLKEHTRRAFLRLLLSAAHHHGIELSISVG